MSDESFMNRNQRRAAKKQGVAPQPRSQPAIQAMFAEALHHHQAGRLAEAERLYRQILALDARHADSLHLLGVLAYQAGRHGSAVDLIGQAIRLKDDVAFYHNNLGLALKDQGKHAEAVARFERALALQPNYPEAHNNLGNALREQGLAADAVASYRRALAVKPDYVEAHNNLGNALRDLDKLDEAIACYRRALAINPGYAEAHNNLGNALQQLGQFDEAVASYRQALAASPDSPAAYNNLANALLELGQLADAITAFGRALTLQPDYPEAHNNLGVAFAKQGEYAKAIASHERALALRPDYAEACNNLGVAFQDQGELDKAIAAFERALAQRPDYAEARKNLGGALHARAGERSGLRMREEATARFGGVRGQYESLPFPARDPEGERHVLYVSVADILGKVNQYCFGGARDFSKGLRVLVAGSGTGDSVIWLAHQLRDTPSEIVALDLSAASLEVAKARARMRGFDNIRWVNASMLDLPGLALGKFDYITCLGVLHHLAEPEAGLAALESVLAEDGGMAVMLYGLHGRSHIYAMQETLRRLTAGSNDREERLALARQVLANLPPTNPFRMREGWDNIQRAYLKDDTNLWDTLLHEQDRAYTASGVRAFLATAGLSVQTFATYKGTPATCALQYDLDLYLSDAAERAHLAALPQSVREDVAETLDGSLALHTVYAARSPQAFLDPTAPDAILSPMSELGTQAIAYLLRAAAPLPVILRNGQTLTYKPSAAARAFLGAVDGMRSNAEIARSLWAEDGARSFGAMAPELKIPGSLHWLIARTESGTPWPVLETPQKFSLPLRHDEPAILVEAGTPARVHADPSPS